MNTKYTLKVFFIILITLISIVLFMVFFSFLSYSINKLKTPLPQQTSNTQEVQKEEPADLSKDEIMRTVNPGKTSDELLKIEKETEELDELSYTDEELQEIFNQ